MVYITSRRHTQRQVPDVEVKMYSNQATASLRLNGADLGMRPVVDHVATWKVRLAEGANRLDVAAGIATDSIEWQYRPASALQ
jgi:beta-galactosidase